MQSFEQPVRVARGGVIVIMLLILGCTYSWDVRLRLADESKEVLTHGWNITPDIKSSFIKSDTQIDRDEYDMLLGAFRPFKGSVGDTIVEPRIDTLRIYTVPKEDSAVLPLRSSFWISWARTKSLHKFFTFLPNEEMTGPLIAPDHQLYIPPEADTVILRFYLQMVPGTLGTTTHPDGINPTRPYDTIIPIESVSIDSELVEWKLYRSVDKRSVPDLGMGY